MEIMNEELQRGGEKADLGEVGGAA